MFNLLFKCSSVDMIKVFLIILTLSFTSSQNFYGLYEYIINPSVPNNSVARMECADMNGILAVIHNSSVNQFIIDLIKHTIPQFEDTSMNRAFWIGLRRTGPNITDFMWDDMTALNYHDWGTDEPDNGKNPRKINEGCVMFGHPCCVTYKWFDVKCNQQFPPGQIQPGYICQRKIESHTTDTHTTSVPSTSTETTSQILTTSSSTSNNPTSISSAIEPLQTTISTKLDNSESSVLENLFYYIIPAVICIILLILLIIVFVMYKRKGRPRTRSVGKIKVRSQTSVYHTTELHQPTEKTYDVDEFDDDDDDDDNRDDDNVSPTENVYQSTTSLERPRENTSLRLVNNLNASTNVSLYESVSSMDLTKEHEFPKRHQYTKVKKMKKPNFRKSIEIADDEDGYTTVADNGSTQHDYKEPKHYDDNQVEFVDEDPILPTSPPVEIYHSEYKETTQENESPYVTVPEMESLTDNTYSQREQERDSSFQLRVDLYDELDQSR